MPQNRKIPYFKIKHVYFVCLILYIIMTAPLTISLYIKNLAQSDTLQQQIKQVFRKDSIQYQTYSLYSGTMPFSKELELGQDSLKVNITYQKPNSQPSKKSVAQQTVEDTEIFMYWTLLAALICGVSANVPFSRYFKRKRKGKPIEKWLEEYCRSKIIALPYINTTILFTAFSVYHIYLWYKMEHISSDCTDFEFKYIQYTLYISLTASTLILLFMFSWLRHLLQNRYIEHVFTPEELRKSPYRRHTRLRNRLWLSILVAIFLPVAIGAFYLTLSFTSVQNLEQPITNEHLKILFGNYIGVYNSFFAPGQPTYVPLGLFYYINALDTALLVTGMICGIFVSIVYILLFVRWINSDISLAVNELVENMQVDEHGNMGNFAIVRSNDEIGILAERFNVMRQRIIDYVSEISAMNRDLENKVRERTLELEQSREEIIAQRDHVLELNNEMLAANEEIRTANDALNERNEQLNETLQHLKHTQSQLVQSEKMASLGQLTAGIAHEINNPINFVSGNIKPLQRDIEDLRQLLELYRQGKHAEAQQFAVDIDYNYVNDEIDKLLLGIQEGATRTAEIVRGLRTFSRLDEQDLKEADIHQNIEATLVLLHNQYKRNIEIVKHYGNIPLIECYSGKLNQVFMNLIVNAIQAISGQGKIEISTRVKDSYVLFSVKDNGCGISEEIKQRIFEPFFTTKDVGKGMGLGLSITLGIIQEHKGTIEVNSTVGKGTEFVVTLPIKQKQ